MDNERNGLGTIVEEGINCSDLAGEHDFNDDAINGDDQPPYDAMELTCWIHTMFI